MNKVNVRELRDSTVISHIDIFNEYEKIRNATRAEHPKVFNYIMKKYFIRELAKKIDLTEAHLLQVVLKVEKEKNDYDARLMEIASRRI